MLFYHMNIYKTLKVGIAENAWTKTLAGLSKEITRGHCLLKHVRYLDS